MGVSQSRKIYSIGDLQMSPKELFSEVFKLQGIPIDPKALDHVVEDIKKTIGPPKSKNNGIDSYDIFIGYRKFSDRDLAEKLYFRLKSDRYQPFWDESCLINSKNWKDGFTRALSNSDFFLPLVSADGIGSVSDCSLDFSNDNHLIEMNLALTIAKDTDNPLFIVPGLVGKYQGKTYSRFDFFDTSTFADVVKPRPGKYRVNIASGKYVGDKANGKANGLGSCTWSTGKYMWDSYDGNFKDDKFDGHGKLTYSDGGIYDGEFKDDKRCGRGKMSHPDGNVYEGAYKNNKRNGHGKFSWTKKGDVYDGEYSDDKRHGHGKKVWMNGGSYEGEWRNDKRNGVGVFTSAQGEERKGIWKDDKMNGRGEHTWPSGQVYDGDFKDHMMSGKGVMTFANGDVYTGDWEGDLANGFGSMTFANGSSSLAGMWVKDIFQSVAVAAPSSTSATADVPEEPSLAFVTSF